jgi:nucleoside-diphosphate-sugar epimerase
MAKIAILGATSQIARDLILSLSNETGNELYLFARRTVMVESWLVSNGIEDRYSVADFSGFGTQDFDAVINFVGAGDPAQIASLGSSILDITLSFDEMVLNYLTSHPACRYLFLSSGAAYGSNFSEPARRDTPAIVGINDLAPHEWYGVAKLHAECRHRAHPELPIVDIRVFNHFSRTQDIAARFLITDILRAIRDKKILKTSPDHIVRDFLHPSDFHRLVSAVISAPPANAAIDCYSRAPISKAELLDAMRDRFGLKYEIADANASVNATGSKPNYYSLNKRAAEFGYQPTLTSLEGIVLESERILSVNQFV